MNITALNTLIRYATENIAARAAAQQTEIYDAISSVLPDPLEALAAERLAFSIRETEKLQLDFLNLFKSDQPPAAPDSNGPQIGI